jgi:sulfatase maturation enzyme AslB (radical SAM superfamily)
MCFPSIGGEKISRELSKINFSNLNEIEESCCADCSFVNICITCYAENYISRGSVSRRDMSLCFYNKLIFVALAKYEYARILRLNEPTSEDIKKMIAINSLKDEIKKIEDVVRE